MAYLYLAIAIVGEVIATSALKASEEFTKLVPSIVVVIGYGVAFYFMTLTIRTLPIGITYAIWSGVGIVLVTVAGAVFYKQIPDIPAMIGIGFIILGVIVINVFSKSVSH
ncbi:DMT family transporter [Terasakiella pusilla]|jgi:small multidrug resistance pump|uniref:DMT family transporter n=1 Tax=Terasakiella pusilla TaxID=64973 RepID=UPI000491EC13|nr:multidrug efflux SMR transporter [Terasakiella pusilla]